MTAQVYKDSRMFPSNSAITKFLRVKMTAGYLVAAGLNEFELGVLNQSTLAADNLGSVKLLAPNVTTRMVAAGAISAYVNVYRAAGGKISPTVSGPPIGVSLEAASGNNSVIEVLPCREAGMVFVGGALSNASASDTVVTGLANVVACGCSFGSDPSDGNFLCSASIGDQAGAPAAGSIYVKAWKNTSGTDPTPVASSVFTQTINWWAVGTM